MLRSLRLLTLRLMLMSPREPDHHLGLLVGRESLVTLEGIFDADLAAHDKTRLRAAGDDQFS